jgi:hypothetical protein
MTADSSERLPWQGIREQALDIGRAITKDRPPFTLQLEWPTSYQDLFAGSDAEKTPEQALLERALKTGRVLVASEPGSGKTWLLARLIELAAASAPAIPIMIQLKNLSASEPVFQEDGLEPIINRLLTIAAPDPRPILASSGHVPLLILMVDGLNEIPRGPAESVIAAVDELARRYPFLSVIITDRLVRRPIDLNRWRLATILPLPEDVVREALASVHTSRDLSNTPEILKRPFFLDTALTTDITGDSESATIEAYFTRHIGIGAADLENLAETAFAAYQKYHGRTMSESWFKGHVQSNVFRRLVRLDAVRTSREQVWFTHHLLHDFLAARTLAARKNEWRPEVFDDITLTAASFDSLRLTIEQVPEVADADVFIRRVYNWNYYGAAYALVQGYVSEEMRAVILAMLADKKWDLIWATVVQATDALRLDGSAIALNLLGAQSRSELFRVVHSIESDAAWFHEWVVLFTTSDGTVADEAAVAALQAEDSITSWTLANVLRRSLIDAEGMHRLLDISSDGLAVVRWRAVHVLGGHPSDESARSLQARLVDPDRWVRYGAVRSIVEIAARTNEFQLRDVVISMLMQLIQSRELDDSMQRELGRALDVRPQPGGWAEAVAPMIQQLLGLSETLAEQDRWGRVMATIILSVPGQ